MDTFEPFKEFQFKNIILPIKRYEEYSKGKLISKGSTSLTIVIEQLEKKIQVHLVESNLETIISSEFEFDLFITLNDRLQLTINPRKSNIQDATLQMITHVIGYTRESKNFTSNEPIVGHVFTNDMNVVKIAFKMSSPERLIEFYT